MNKTSSQYTRRQFLQGLGFSAVCLSIAAKTPFAFARDSSVLPFRLNSPELMLHFNENSLGMSPKALSAAAQAIKLYGNRYPDDAYEMFKEKLAAHHSIHPDQLIFGNGSTEVLRAIANYAGQIKATMIEPIPTFGALKRYCEAQDVNVIQVPVQKDFTMSIAAMKKQANEQAGAVLINLCNPNNPTGNFVDFGVLFDWINNAPDDHLFLLDEAYYEYALSNPQFKSGLDLIQQGKENVVISRTFSKVYGMAGMRIGYGIATASTASKITPFSAGFNMNIGAIAAASASLDDAAFFEKSIKSNAESKTIVTNVLDELGLSYVPSDTNFILHRINTPLAEYSEKMRQNGIRVGRKMTDSDRWNRLSLGTPDEMQIFTKTLVAFRDNKWV